LVILMKLMKGLMFNNKPKNMKGLMFKNMLKL
jgi:hypothetical protein